MDPPISPNNPVCDASVSHSGQLQPKGDAGPLIPVARPQLNHQAALPGQVEELICPYTPPLVFFPPDRQEGLPGVALGGRDFIHLIAITKEAGDPPLLQDTSDDARPGWETPHLDARHWGAPDIPPPR